MTFTQKELEAMSNFELNAVVAKLFLPYDYIVNEKDKSVELAIYKDVMAGGMHDQVLSPYAEFNPCNNWKDCGSLIDEGQISLIKDERIGYYANTGWLHHSDAVLDSRFESYHNNSKRAVTIVYILIKQGDK